VDATATIDLTAADNNPLQPPAGVRCGVISSGRAPAAAERERYVDRETVRRKVS
jgi:hypothetical protein